MLEMEIPPTGTATITLPPVDPVLALPEALTAPSVTALGPEMNKLPPLNPLTLRLPVVTLPRLVAIKAVDPVPELEPFKLLTEVLPPASSPTPIAPPVVTLPKEDAPPREAIGTIKRLSLPPTTLMLTEPFTELYPPAAKPEIE